MQLTFEDELALLEDGKKTVTKLIAMYAEKASKKDFWEDSYNNAKQYYIRRAQRINSELKRLKKEKEIAEAQRGAGEVPAQKEVPRPGQDSAETS